MADFAEWAVAAAPSLGHREEAFLRAYDDMQQIANELPLDSSPIVPPLWTVAGKAWEQGQSWVGTATNLLDAISLHVDDATRKMKSWPKAGRALSNTLRRLQPNLHQAGMAVVFIREAHTGNRLIELSQVLVSGPGGHTSGRKYGDANAPRQPDVCVTQGIFASPETGNFESEGDEGDGGDANSPISSLGDLTPHFSPQTAEKPVREEAPNGTQEEGDFCVTTVTFVTKHRTRRNGGSRGRPILRCGRGRCGQHGGDGGSPGACGCRCSGHGDERTRPATFRLGLIQIGTPNSIYLVDPLAVDLAPLAPFLEAENRAAYRGAQPQI